MPKHIFSITQVPNVTWLTLNNLLKVTKNTDCVMLYLRYAYHANVGQTNQPWATTQFIMNGLGWGRDKVQRTRKQLEDLGYIKVIKVRDENGYLWLKGKK
jgi:hypothetical protein